MPAYFAYVEVIYEFPLRGEGIEFGSWLGCIMPVNSGDCIWAKLIWAWFMLGMKTGAEKDPHWEIGIVFITFRFIAWVYAVLGICCIKLWKGFCALKLAGAL